MTKTKKKLAKKKRKKTDEKSSPLRKPGTTLHTKESTQTKSENAVCGDSKAVKKLCKKTKSSVDSVKRIYTPYNKFTVTPPAATSNTMAPQTYRPSCNCNNTCLIRSSSPNGLSTKERAYLVSRCSARTTRYSALKTRANEAIKHNKIFTICGNCNAVRKALVARGWVEKIPPNRMTLARIRHKADTSSHEVHLELERILLSNLVERCEPNFIWRTREASPDTADKEYNVMVNKLRIDAKWTTKQGLCTSMKENYWHYIEDVAEVTCPRTYTSHDSGDVEDFVSDFKLTACTSLLKWVLSMAANHRPIFCQNGTMSLNVIIFALNRCKEYLFRKQNKDIDKNLSSISVIQWNAFLKKYYSIISKEAVFELDKENKLPVYLAFAKFLLKEIHRYRPQLSCEGAHNIWIIKPAHCSRGRGIRMASKLGLILNVVTKPHAKFVVQKYIEEPLLIHETKFDIRQYYLVTSTHPLVIWMYKDCYLKFSSQKYSLKNFHESIHLTNNAVQKHYKNCKGRHPDLPTNNMWHLETYKKYLNSIGKEKVWENIIYPGMKRNIIGSMLSNQGSLSFSKNRFELYGCDFILDKEYKPWLIEINSCPDLNHTTAVTAKICPEVISDIIKVVIDNAANSRASTGKFQCIYRQTLTIPRYSGVGDLVVMGHALRRDYFYRGPVKLEEPCINDAIETEQDIEAILDRLKQKYDRDDIMIEPENDSNCMINPEETVSKTKTNSEQKPDVDHNESDDELTETAKLINSQISELMKRITSDPDSQKDTFDPRTTSAHRINKKKESFSKSLASVKSATNINSLIKKSVHLFGSLEMEMMRNFDDFDFSKLEYGPNGKGILIGSAFETVQEKTVSPAKGSLLPRKSISVTSTPKDTILKAATNVLDFLNRKEVEYKIL